MRELHFETTQPQTELFLTSETLGFLMLSASGGIYRKWQGLCIGDLSIFADISWSLSHENDANFSSEKNQPHWIRTSRTNTSILRTWQMNCGCDVFEKWDWPRRSSEFKVSWTRGPSTHCKSSNPRSILSVSPQWTLCPAGVPQTGGAHAQIIFDPRAPQCLNVQSELMPDKISFTALAADSEQPSTWTTLDSPVHLEPHTHADFTRGENPTRSVLKTHESKITLAPHQSAFIRVILAESASATRQPPPNSAQPAEFECSTKNTDWPAAFANARESLNQLVRRRTDGVLGLQAGLPWFTQFWTRDMCHSFRAAFLWSGRIDDGRKLICDLWATAETEIPNYTTVSATTTNSADAMPLLLLSTADLVDFAGLTEDLRAIMPRLLGHMRNTAKIFQKGLLVTHGPADTWMDAQKTAPSGELLPCSPRANRAFEIQAFWIAALVRWADILVRTLGSEDAELFAAAARTGLKTLREQFYNPEKKRWADHLRPDGSQDCALRPNLLLGFSALQKAGVLGRLLRENELEATLKDMNDSDLIVSYGVRTLSPETPVRYPSLVNEIYGEESAFIFENKIHFHPYHEFGSRRGLEHPDWAYHNGTIWPWLSHSAVQLLLHSSHSEKAHQLTQTLVWHGIHGTQGGALPELLDGLTSHSHWSWPKGAPHQAWSEAALVNIIIEEWLGVCVSNFSKTLKISTRKWNEIGDFSITLPLVQARVLIQKTKSEIKIDLTDKQSASALELEVYMTDGKAEPFFHAANVFDCSLPLRLNLTSS